MDRTMQMVYETEREQYEQAMRIVPEAGLGGGDG